MNKRSGAKPISDKDAAAELARRIRLVLNSSLGETRAPFDELIFASRNIQRRVLELLRPRRQFGRPKKALTDEEWREGVEAYRGSRQVSEREAIKLWLTDTGTRWGREPGEKFRPETSEGKKEVRRIQDACTRARRAAKTKKAR